MDGILPTPTKKTYLMNPKKTHTTTVKHILRSLRGTMEKGLILDSNHKHEIECFEDNNFSGDYTKLRAFYQLRPILGASKI